MANLSVRARHKLRRVALHLPNRLTVARNLAVLEQTGNPRLQATARAVRAVVAGALTPRERSSIAAIEAVRAELLSSETRLDARWSELTGRTEDANDRFVETVSAACRRSRPPLWCRLLFKLLRELAPAAALELGTCVGISAAYQATALDLNDRGTLVTIEGIASRADLAEDVFRRLGLRRVELRRGRFEEVLPTLSSKLPPIEFAFVDGNHSERATLAYFDALLPLLASEAVVVFDDIRYSDGMERAWDWIRLQERVATAVDLGPVGLCLLGPAGECTSISLPLEPKPVRMAGAVDRSRPRSAPRAERETSRRGVAHPRA